MVFRLIHVRKCRFFVFVLRKVLQTTFVLGILSILSTAIMVGSVRVSIAAADEPAYDVVVLDLEESYYDALSTDVDRLLYQKIGEAVELSLVDRDAFVETGIRLTGDTDHVSHVAHMYLYDHPKYGSFWSGCRLSIRRDSLLRILWDEAPEDMVPDAVYQDILNREVSGASEAQLAFSAFRWMSEHVDYDVDRGVHHDDDYGAMVEGKACCQGISFAYKRMLDLLGIPCVVLTCYTEEGTYHMVDAVRLGDGWIVCDMTSAIGHESPSFQAQSFGLEPEMARSTLVTGVYVPFPGCIGEEDGDMFSRVSHVGQKDGILDELSVESFAAGMKDVDI